MRCQRRHLQGYSRSKHPANRWIGAVASSRVGACYPLPLVIRGLQRLPGAGGQENLCVRTKDVKTSKKTNQLLTG